MTDLRIWRSVHEVPADLGRTVVTIGNFDGVHRGHQHVVRRSREVAGPDGTVVAVTFDPHPMAVLRPEHAPSMLTTVEVRSELLGRAGADAVLVLPFDKAMSGWTPEEFIQRVLVDALNARGVVVGANFRFGNKAAGEVSTLREAGERHGFLVDGIALDGGPQVWSSTYVRTCLSTGDVSGAAEALGRPFSVRGVVVEGDRRGRDLGFPTANVPTTTSAATSSATRRRTCPPPGCTRRPPTGCTPGGCVASTGTATRCPPRSASAPTRPSRATASAVSSRTCSTVTTSSCTACRWRCRSSRGCGA